MNLATRRRLAAVVALSAASTATAVALTASPSAASVVSVSPTTAGNYTSFPQPVTVTFTLTVDPPSPTEPTGNAVPPRSKVNFTRVGASGTTADTFSSQVTGNTPNSAGDRQYPSTSVDFSNPQRSSGSGPADPGDYNVAFTDPSGKNTLDSCSDCFHVVAAGAPTVTALSPSQIAGSAGGPINVAATGTNLAMGTVLTVLPAPAGDPRNVTVAPDQSSSGGTTADGTTKHYLFTVPANAVPGPRDVQVTNTDGKSSICTGCFTVLGANLTGVSPGAATNTDADNAQSITFTGPAGSIKADGVPSLSFIGNAGSSTKTALSIPASQVSPPAPDGSSITAVYNLVAAAPGDSVYQPTVTSASGSSVSVCTCKFTIVQPAGAPTVTSLNPASQAAGTTQSVTVTGTNFARGANVAVSGTGVTTTAVQFVSRTQLNATMAVAPTAATGARNVTVGNTDGATSPVCTGCYTITAGASPTPTATATATPTATSSPGTFAGFSRVAGTDRYDTAAKLATDSFPTGATNVIVANGESDNASTGTKSHFPDALAGAYLAGNKSAPTLLTMRDTLPNATRNALAALHAKNVTILGGVDAVSNAVQQDLARSYTVTRISGTTRYDTAKAVAETPGASYVGADPNKDLTAVIANGQNFPDALAAGPMGYKSKFPILITTPDALSPQTRQVLTDLKIKHVLIAGGTTAVSDNVKTQIEAMSISTQRFNGSSRMDTAAQMAAYEYDVLAYPVTHVNLANGGNFPDALSGGPHAGTDGAPVLLTNTPTVLGNATENFLKSRSGKLKDGHIFGGTSAVSQAVEDQAAKDANGGNAPSPAPSASSTVSPSASASTKPSTSATPSASSTCGVGVGPVC